MCSDFQMLPIEQGGVRAITISPKAFPMYCYLPDLHFFENKKAGRFHR
jgi:hypothetical protein